MKNLSLLLIGLLLTQNTYAVDTVLRTNKLKLGKGDGSDVEYIFNTGAANPPKLIYNSTDGKIQFSEDGTVLKNIGSGSGLGENFIEAGDGDTGTTGWVSYDDGVSALPVDGTGGTGAITLTKDASAPLAENASLLITKDAVNRQGHGVSYDFTISSAAMGQPLTLVMDYQIASGSYTSGGDSSDPELLAYIYDKDAGQLVQPVPYKVLGGSGKLQFITEFQPVSSSSDDFRIIFHQTLSGTNAYSLRFDNLRVGRQSKSYGPPVTSYRSCSTSGSWTTNTTYTAICRRVGDEMEGHILVSLSGAPNSATLTVNVPNGHSIDTSKLTTTTRNFVGQNWSVDDGNTNYHGRVEYLGGVLRPETLDDATGGVTSAIITQSAPFTFGSGDTVLLSFKAPIVGWESSVQMSNSVGTRAVKFGAYKSGSTQATVAGTPLEVVLNNTRFDSHGSYSTSTGRFTAPESGTYSFKGAATFTAGATPPGSVNIFFVKNGVTSVQYGIAFSSDLAASKQYSWNISADIDLQAGDYVSLYVLSDTQSVTVNTTGDTNDTTFMYGHKAGPGQQIAASETVVASYSTDAGASIASGTATYVDFEDVDFDRFNSVVDAGKGASTTSTSTWRFVAPMSGVYRISGCATFSPSGSWGSGEQAELLARKNGGTSWPNEKNLSRQERVFTSTEEVPVCGTTLFDLDAGDYLQLAVRQNSGSSITLLGNNKNTFIDIERIGF